MNLWPHQSRVFDELRPVLAELPPDKRRVLLVSPVGSGKTTIGAEYARRKGLYGLRGLWIAHRTELIDQAAQRLEQFKLSVGVIAAGSSRTINPHRPVQVASIQTLTARGQLPDADYLVWDEVHHIRAETYQKVLGRYPLAQHLGLTATPERADGRPLSDFERLIVVAQPRELTEQGYLVPCHVIAPNRYLKPGEIAQRPVDAYQAHAIGRSALVFSPTVEAAEKHAAEFVERGIEAVVIDGETPRGQRRQALERFTKGNCKVIVNVGVLTEGTDLPICSCVILARGCGTEGLYIQITGRGLRTYPGKIDCLLIDLRGVSHIHGHPCEDRIYSLEGDVGIKRASEPNPYSACLVCGAPKEPGEPCQECGTQPRSNELVVTGDVLSKWEFMRTRPLDSRARSLARWIKAARNKGRKEGSAMHKYKAVFGGWPPSDVVAMAKKELEK